MLGTNTVGTDRLRIFFFFFFGGECLQEGGREKKEGK